jgi:ornithine cyclodeaminase/alanine dehydrogenase-like protein (mu-crystallin family)
LIFLNEKDLAKLAKPELLISAIESAILCYDKGTFQMPLRMHLNDAENTHLLMPAITDDTYAVKLVSVNPGNKKLKRSVIHGLVTLFHKQTGQPIAILDGSKLTALRTAAVGACSIKYLSNQKSSTLGMVGLGAQGIHLAIMTAQVRPIKRIMIFNYNSIQSIAFAGYVKEKLGIEVVTCNDMTDLVKHSEIIITATNSAKPVLPEDMALYQKQCICAIGSFTPAMQELPNALYEKLENLYCDTLHAKQETGDIINPLELGLINEEQISTIASLVKSQSIIENELTCFKSVGMALFDLFVAKAFYQNANNKGVGQILNL